MLKLLLNLLLEHQMMEYFLNLYFNQFFFFKQILLNLHSRRISSLDIIKIYDRRVQNGKRITSRHRKTFSSDDRCFDYQKPSTFSKIRKNTSFFFCRNYKFYSAITAEIFLIKLMFSFHNRKDTFSYYKQNLECRRERKKKNVILSNTTCISHPSLIIMQTFFIILSN